MERRCTDHHAATLTRNNAFPYVMYIGVHTCIHLEPGFTDLSLDLGREMSLKSTSDALCT
jgi:hypothetical protein